MKKKLLTLSLLLIIALNMQAQNPATGKVVLQAFWWNYWNNNYPAGWFNYLAELAPRLKQMGIDGVWIPPNTKASGVGDNGYGPFDNYDLGDKYQKGGTSDANPADHLKTRSGDKNEFLRMVAVMHANGIDVIQDIIFNDVSNAGSANAGLGGVDPAAVNYATSVGLSSANDNTKGYKNFRYACYQTPIVSETATDYINRQGRWPKNWQNFSPNPANSDYTSDLAASFFGPDISYDAGAYGQSSNATYNPVQTASYMENNARYWAIWYKKQTGFDGVRLDAAKNFSYTAAEDFLWNLQNNAGFASGGANMYAVGEFVDGNPNSGAPTDSWVQAVQNRAGTFDYCLRYGLSDMVAQSGGSYDLTQIKGKMQYNRNKIAPFVNNHDTFKPVLDTLGNITSWTDNVGMTHIDPTDPRVDAAYAIAMTVDGSPTIYIEDLFNIGHTGKRWTHHPTSTTELPVMDDISNLIRCHNKLSFKAGSLQWRWEAADHLVMERTGKALIGITDNYSTSQTSNVSTSFPDGTVLMDFGGSIANTVTVSGGKVNITTPPCNGSQKRKGYSVWAPVSMKPTFDADFAPATRTTTQQWELSNDLGDSHVNSLLQGGSIPASSIAYRTAGKIFALAGTPIKVSLTPTVDSTQSLTLVLGTCNGTSGVDSVSGKGTISLTYTPSTTQYITLKARNTVKTNTGQGGVLITSTYTAPQVISTASYPSTESCTITGINNTTEQETFYLYPNPTTGRLNIDVNNTEATDLKVMDMLGKEVYHETLQISAGQARTIDLSNLQKGIYMVRMNIENNMITKKIILF